MAAEMPRSLARFLASDAGRLVRVGGGLGLMSLGWRRGGLGGAVLALVGLIPLTCGVTDRCLISYLLGGPIKGQEIREG